MQLTVTRLGDIRRQTDAIIRAGKQAHSTVIRRKTTTIKNAMRRKVAAKLGKRMGNTIQSLTFPSSGASMNAAGSVYSKAIYKRPGGLVDLITVFREGAVIHPVTGEFLLIGGRKSIVEKLGKIVGRIARGKSVRILPRIDDLDAEYTRLTPSIPEDIAKEYDRLLERIT